MHERDYRKSVQRSLHHLLPEFVPIRDVVCVSDFGDSSASDQDLSSNFIDTISLLRDSSFVMLRRGLPKSGGPENKSAFDSFGLPFFYTF